MSVLLFSEHLKVSAMIEYKMDACTGQNLVVPFPQTWTPSFHRTSSEPEHQRLTSPGSIGAVK